MPLSQDIFVLVLFPVLLSVSFAIPCFSCLYTSFCFIRFMIPFFWKTVVHSTFPSLIFPAFIVSFHDICLAIPFEGKGDQNADSLWEGVYSYWEYPLDLNHATGIEMARSTIQLFFQSAFYQKRKCSSAWALLVYFITQFLGHKFSSPEIPPTSF